MSDNRCIYYVHLVPFHSHIALTTARFQEAPGEGVENRRVYGPEGYVAPFTFTFPRCSVPRSKSCIFLEFQDYSEHFNTCVVSKSARYFTRFLHVPGVPPPLPRFPPSRSSLGCSFFCVSALLNLRCVFFCNTQRIFLYELRSAPLCSSKSAELGCKMTIFVCVCARARVCVCTIFAVTS